MCVNSHRSRKDLLRMPHIYREENKVQVALLDEGIQIIEL